MKASLRRYYIQRYGDLYKRAKDIPLDVCVYCGDTRQTLDHCPPISKLEFIDVQKAIKKGLKFILYPACNECNAHLSAKMTIDELGPTLKSLIQKTSNKAAHFANKARTVLDRLDKMQGRPDGD